jgi:Ca2+-transporting ATPase
MGRIGLSLQNITLEEPGLKEQLRWLVRDAAIFGVAVAVLVVLASGFLRHSWLEAALGGVAIGMSVMPEEIPLVLAVFMAMGAWRLSRAHILTRRASAIETLGSATVLCTDKTGTLTENRMRVELLVQGGNTWRRSDTEPAPSPSLDRIVTGAVAASAPRPTDPMDRAVHAIAGEHAAGSDVLLHTYPLTAELLAFTNIWKHAASGDVFAAAKGAPEAIAGLCHLSPDEHAKLTATVDAFAREGIRLLAVADARLPGESSPATPHDIPFAFVGLVGFIDPVRASVPDAVRQCREAGVRVAMITGDYPATAVAIAGQAGIASDSVLTGAELEALDDVALAERIRAVGVFARIRPHQKLRIVEALKRDGEVVAMTGDGINDAPAIKAAHIGIAMGARGTDVAREAAALVLLDDEFSSIVAAIRLGRRIYDNLRKAIQYIVAVHIPIAGLALLPILFGMPLMLLPVQIALLEMLIDPACSIVFETEGEEANVMRRPPRDPKAPVLPHSTLIWAAIQGAASLAVVTLALVIGVAAKIPEDDLRALVFTVLVLMNIGLILVNRAQSSSLRDAFLRANPALWILSGLVLVLLALALYWPPLRGLFHFGHLHLDDVSACVAVGLVFVLALETLKRWLRLQ